MKHNITIFCILLITGLFLLGPVSAASVIDHGSKTVVVHKDVLYHVYKWTTYKYNNYNVEMFLTNTTYLLGKPYWTSKYTVTIKKVGVNKLKVTQSMTSATGKTHNYNVYYKFKGANAVKFYNTQFFKKYYLKAYLT